MDAVKEALHRQYLYKMENVLAENRDKNYVRVKELLENALRETLPELQVNEIGKSVLGESESVIEYGIYKVSRKNGTKI